MAYFSQTQKKEIAPTIRKILKQYGLKGSIAVENYSTLVINIREGNIDFDVNERGYNVIMHPINKNKYTEEAESCLLKLQKIMNQGNHDNSDYMTDYYDVGWYTTINIGSWEKPYVLKK